MANRCPDRVRRRELFALSRTIDPDPFRNRLRAALASGDVAAQRSLKTDDASRNLPATSVALFAYALATTGDVPGAIAILSEAQGRFPGDFWINQDLGYWLQQSTPPRLDESARYLTAAFALKPDAAWAAMRLGSVLDRLGKRADAASAYRTAICLKPEDSRAHRLLGITLAAQGEHAEAADALREAIRLKPDQAVDHHILGQSLAAQGKLAEATIALREAIRLRPDVASARNELGNVLGARRDVGRRTSNIARRSASSPTIPIPTAISASRSPNRGGARRRSPSFARPSASIPITSRPAWVWRPHYAPRRAIATRWRRCVERTSSGSRRQTGGNRRRSG